VYFVQLVVVKQQPVDVLVMLCWDFVQLAVVKVMCFFLVFVILYLDSFPGCSVVVYVVLLDFVAMYSHRHGLHLNSFGGSLR